MRPRLRPAHQLGQAPVEHDDFAEIAQDHVLALEVAVDDPARVRIGHGVADRDEGIQQRRQLERIGLARQPLVVVVAGGFAQGAALDEAHGVKRLPAVPRADQLVNRNDPGMFELAGDLCLLEEARPERGVLGVLGPQLLEGNVPAQVAVVSQPDATDAAGRVQAEPAIALRLPGNVVDGRRSATPPRAALRRASAGCRRRRGRRVSV